MRLRQDDNPGEKVPISMPNFYQGDGKMVPYLLVNLVLKQGELGGIKIKGQDLYTRTSTYMQYECVH